MRTRTLVLAGLAAALLTTMSTRAQQPVSPDNAPVPEMPKQATRTGKHVNRVIDMWLKGQPVYYSQIAGGGYDKGKEMAATKADYITYEMEHGPLDFKELRDFMRGLVEAGPTRTGHKTPAVIVTLPIPGTTTPCAPTRGWCSRRWRPASTASCCATPRARKPPA